MSKSIKLSGIKVTNLDDLKAACKTLGISVEKVQSDGQEYHRLTGNVFNRFFTYGVTSIWGKAGAYEIVTDDMNLLIPEFRDCIDKLKQAYSAQTIKRLACERGYRVTEKRVGGKIRLEIELPGKRVSNRRLTNLRGGAR